eukprot:CAMPEP_0183744976 /NCGR_PEP_ID=MMETSP0737-20130205/66002_1 /TAXON_ID=385413 /ORGANISM="Thalassiosira miniscula, Strain CCMP1093" /LENGTH=493 /DNA_ID=CAMNT_0025980631 /DNA_START=295 /DNA_END=1776 /DNA_ORIENTATION=+
MSAMPSNIKSAESVVSPTKRRKPNPLPSSTVEYLKAWMMSPDHIAHPYPTEQEKAQIMAETGIELKQLTNWFVNNRKRYWKPRVESKLGVFAQAGIGTAAAAAALSASGGGPTPTHHMRPIKTQTVPRLLPTLQPSKTSPSTHALPYSLGVSSSAQPSSLVGSPTSAFGPVHTGVQNQDQADLHMVSACNSDDDSTGASSSSHRSGAASSSSQCHVSPLASGNTARPFDHAPSSGYWRHEEVDISILRPDSDSDGCMELPSLRDVTIKTSIPEGRVLALFKSPISYTIPYSIQHDGKKVQSRRDGEILRAKKHYLKLYLAATTGVRSSNSTADNERLSAHFPVSPSTTYLAATTGVRSSNSTADNERLSAHFPVSPSTTAPMATSNNAHFVSPACSDPLASSVTSGSSAAVECKQESMDCLRVLGCDGLQDNNRKTLIPRKRERVTPIVKGEDEWRNLCQNATSLYCESLPGLEEAAMMFGYVSHGDLHDRLA